MFASDYYYFVFYLFKVVLAMIYVPVNLNSARHLLKLTDLTGMSKYWQNILRLNNITMHSVTICDTESLLPIAKQNHALPKTKLNIYNS